jgi:hypothetical protein
MKENEPIMSKTISQHVASLEDGYASLLLENKQLGEENQSLTKAVRELEDQQAITRQAYQNLLHEKDTTIAGLDETVAAKLKHIELLDKALAQAKEANATLDHRLELMGRRTATSVRIEGDKDRDNPLGAGPSDQSKAYNSSTCDCDDPGPYDRDNRCTKCGRKYAAPNPLGDPGLSHPYEAHDLGRIDDMANAVGKAGTTATPIPPTFGEVQLAKSIYHNPYYMAIRQLLTFEGKRVLDVLLKLDGVSD